MTDIFTKTKGVTLYVDVDYNISSATTLEVHVSGPVSWVNSATASVSVLGSNFTTSACGVFSANRAVKYVVNSGDFSIEGTYKLWIQAEFGTSTRLVSSAFSFKVDAPG